MRITFLIGLVVAKRCLYQVKEFSGRGHSQDTVPKWVRGYARPYDVMLGILGEKEGSGGIFGAMAFLFPSHRFPGYG